MSAGGWKLLSCKGGRQRRGLPLFAERRALAKTPLLPTRFRIAVNIQSGQIELRIYKSTETTLCDIHENLIDRGDYYF
jgi:hypothetical protein